MILVIESSDYVLYDYDISMNIINVLQVYHSSDFLKDAGKDYFV